MEEKIQIREQGRLIYMNQDDAEKVKVVTLGSPVKLESLIAVARYGARVDLDDVYRKRVQKSRALVEKWIQEKRVMYGITTGFGALCNCVISAEETARLQKNIILSHATAVGKPLSVEAVRGILFMMLQNMGQGYSGVRLVLLERIRKLLNEGITPYTPGEGSVGYLSVEGHIGLVLLGMGKVYYQGDLRETMDVYKQLDIRPLELAAKEGLALISGTTSPTALAALALYDFLGACKSADIIGAMTLEVSKGTLRAFDDRLMQARPYPEQQSTAANVRALLKDSAMAASNLDHRLQDALSIRAIPQLHGAVKKTFNDALKTLEIEMNTCSDNPIIWPEGDDGLAMSGCHCDSSYVGLEMDSACIAGTMLAKMSERRNDRLINGNLSELPWFLIKNPGINSGLMIPQYTQAGLLNDMKILSHPASVDSIPTCGGQEDYVAMGYNASKKSIQVVEKLEYILAIELLSVYQAHAFNDPECKPGSVTGVVLEELKKHIPEMEEDMLLHPHIEYLRECIHSRKFIQLAEEKVGELKL